METVDPDTGEVKDNAVAVSIPPAPVFDGAGLFASCVRLKTGLDTDTTALSALVRDAYSVSKFAKAFYGWWKRAEGELCARMVGRQAKRIEDSESGMSMSVKAETDWTYDEARLKGLLDLVGVPDGITEEEYEKAMRYKFTPDKRVLNEIAKRGGKVAETINLGVRGTLKHKLEIKGRAK